MKTIETKAVVTEDKRLTVQVPEHIVSGEYHVVVIIDENTEEKRSRPPLNFPIDSYGAWPSHLSLRREDMYGDDGR